VLSSAKLVEQEAPSAALEKKKRLSQAGGGKMTLTTEKGKFLTRSKQIFRVTLPQ